MFETLFGNKSKERILIFIQAREKGYGREIAEFFHIAKTPVQKQLDNLERGGVLVAESVGNTRIYRFNPRYALLSELQSLLEKALRFYPEEDREALLMNRRRPRRKGKPL